MTAFQRVTESNSEYHLIYIYIYAKPHLLSSSPNKKHSHLTRPCLLSLDLRPSPDHFIAKKIAARLQSRRVREKGTGTFEASHHPRVWIEGIKNHPHATSLNVFWGFSSDTANHDPDLSSLLNGIHPSVQF